MVPWYDVLLGMSVVFIIMLAVCGYYHASDDLHKVQRDGYMRLYELKSKHYDRVSDEYMKHLSDDVTIHLGKVDALLTNRNDQ